MIKKNQFAYSVTDGILTLMFVLISATCIYVLFGAYTNLEKTNNLVTTINTDLYNRLNNPKSTIKDSVLIQNEKAFLNQVEIRNKGTLDSTTISFLFQVFTIALVTAGVYLFSNAHKEYKKIKKTAIQQDSNNRTSLILKSLLNHIYSLSWSIRVDLTSKRLGMIAQLRKFITDLHNYLIKVDSNNEVIDKKVIREIIDILGYCKSNLKFREEPEFEVNVSDILTKIEYIEKHLQKRYKTTLLFLEN